MGKTASVRRVGVDSFTIAHHVMGETWPNIPLVAAATVWADWHGIPHAEAREQLAALPVDTEAQHD